VPNERLLVWDVCDGWEPLCKFLNTPIPTESFPQLNKANSDKITEGSGGQIFNRSKYLYLEG